MEHAAVAYRVGGRLILGSIVRTTMGVGLEVDPIPLEMDAPDEVLSAAIEQALAKSGGVVPHPTQDQWKDIFTPFRQAAGVRSFKAFITEAASVSITSIRGQLEFTPHRNLGIQEGFEPLPNDVIVLSPSDPTKVVAVLKTLLNVEAR